jgi:ABC-type nitrate/sulfonate/bicarbonate transport system permease component
MLSSTVGAIVLLLIWEVIVDQIYSGHGTIPSPSQILRQFFLIDGPGLYVESGLHTLHAAVQGWLYGNALAIALAMLVVALPWMERPVLQLGAVTHCLPIVAIGPVLVIVSSGDTPRVVLSAMSVFFVTLVGSLLGLRSVERPVLDAIHAFGGNGLTNLAKARWRAALPSLFAALRVAAPAAILGSIVGEFLGAENGLGVLLINSQQGMNYPRTWTVAIFSTVLAGAAYGLISLIGHWLTPWARETYSNLAGGTAERPSTSKRAPRTVLALKALGSALFSIAIVLLAWVLLLMLFHVSPFIGKGPVDVWLYVFDPDAGADNRAALWSEASISLRDSFIGLLSGTGAALVTAGIFHVVPTIRQIFLGPAMALQSVPLVAMTPLIVLIFGRNLFAIAIIGGIITFFPTLVNVTLALARTPKDATDLLLVFGASRFDTLRKVQIPFALPALFASLRVAAPLGITGALLAEWLATGSGLGYSISSDVATSDYSALWTRVALATFFSLVTYNGIGFIERLVLGRMTDARA